MVFNPATDFLGLWRNIAGNVSKLEMPGLDYVVAALARAGVITVSVSATAPLANQSTTAWLKAAVPSYSAEGQLFLWDPIATAYAAATPALFLDFLQANANQNGVSWYVVTGGPPANVVGNNGDMAIRTDEPGGVYGPKVAGAWPSVALPGTQDALTSATIDNTFGSVEGSLIYRDALVWEALGIGPANSLLTSSGTLPVWESLPALLDLILGTAQGALAFRGAGAWTSLAPGTAGQLLSTNGIGSDPSWVPRTAEFPSGTTMLFQQSTAPTGWVKQTVLNDYGLRVVSGATGVAVGTAFSTVFAQTAVGNTTITQATMPSHTHDVSAILQTGGNDVQGGATTNHNAGTTTSTSKGSDGAHTHSVSLQLAYIDVIIASKA